MHQPFDDDTGYPDDMARNIGAGWDANGAPIPPSWRTPPLSGDAQPFHPLRREQAGPHACWICGRATPRTPSRDWLLALVWDGQARQPVRKWVCGSLCQQMALMLLGGVLRLDQWAA